MNLIKSTALVTAFVAFATAVSASSAQAISFKITPGIANPKTGATNEGAYSDYAGKKGVTTITFDEPGFKAGATSVDINGMNGKRFVTYSFEKGMSAQAYSGQTGVYNDKWAAAGPKGEVNNSKYLAVFQGDEVKMTFAKTMNYFGIDWGAISGGNIFSFYNKGQLVKSFSTEDVNPVAPVHASQHGGEGNGYLHFMSSSAKDVFDEIKIIQKGGGGFESDNHSFMEGTGAFHDPQSVPEPTMTLGLMVVGGSFLLKQRKKLA